MKRIVIVMLLLLALGGYSLAADQQLDLQQYVLDNGLEVILVRDASAPTVAVNIWYRVGGANDPQGKSGFAHLFEHIMFEGSPHLPDGGMDQLLEAVGGSLNAFTGTDVTGYYQTLPSHQLPLALWLEADRMGGLAVTQENLDNQRAIVIEELQLRYDNSPYGTAVRALLTAPYTYEPYKRHIAGSIEDVNNALVEDVKSFHRTWYLPNNATLVVAGDIDFEATRALIDDLFAPVPRGDDPPSLPEYLPMPQEAAEIINIEDPLINLPALIITYEIPPLVSDDYPALVLLDNILSSGDSSRLAKSLLDTGQALQASSLVLDNRGPGIFGIILIPNMGVELETIEQVVYDEMQLILEQGVPQDELDKAIALIKSGQILGLETALGLAGSVQTANYYFGDPQAVFSGIERYEAVTSEDIQRVLAEYLEEKDRHVITVSLSEAEPAPRVVPYAADEVIDEEPDFRYIIEQSDPPPPLDVNAFSLPTITETVLDNGLEVVVIEQPQMPIISLDIFFAGGATAAPQDLPGLAGMTGALITRGTETRSAQDIAGAIEQVGGAIGSSGASDSLSLGVFALIEDTDLAFELLTDMTLNANFPDSEIERERQQSISSLEASLAEPGFVAGRTFGKVLYAGHPYGNATTFESLEAITRADIVNFYSLRRQPENAVLIIAGAITTEEGLALAEANFSDWQGSAEAVSFPDLSQQAETQIYLVDRPGSTQAQFIIGNLGMEGASLDYFPARVMNEVLGGNFSSRLVQNIREDKGYTYSIGSGFSFPADTGTFRVSAAVRNDVIALTLEEVFKEIERIQTEPLSDEELNDARDGIIGRFALTLETYQDFVESVASYKIRGVEIERLSKWLGLINDVSKDDVLEIANTYIQPDNFVIVVVGDASVIHEQLESVGSVTLLEAE